MISVPLLWSNITLFTSYSPILRVITRASSCGYMVPTLSSSKKLNAGRAFILALFGILLDSLAGSWVTDITLKGCKLILPGTAKRTSIVPYGGLEEAFT